MNDPIAEIRKRFEKYPDAEVEEGDGWIRFLPSTPEGFAVEFHTDREEYIVAFDGWHESFNNIDKALNCFAHGLSGECRLKVVSRGGKAHKWTVEHFRDGEWISDGVTGLLWFPFWRSPNVAYLQNALIKSG